MHSKHTRTQYIYIYLTDINVFLYVQLYTRGTRSYFPPSSAADGLTGFRCYYNGRVRYSRVNISTSPPHTHTHTHISGRSPVHKYNHARVYIYICMYASCALAVEILARGQRSKRNGRRTEQKSAPVAVVSAYRNAERSSRRGLRAPDRRPTSHPPTATVPRTTVPPSTVRRFCDHNARGREGVALV